MAPFLWIFNYNPVGPAIMVALIGVATVFLIYKFRSAIFNYKYLLDGLQNINQKKITIEANSSDMPVILRPENSNDYLYLIMPIRR